MTTEEKRKSWRSTAFIALILTAGIEIGAGHPVLGVVIGLATMIFAVTTQ